MKDGTMNTVESEGRAMSETAKRILVEFANRQDEVTWELRDRLLDGWWRFSLPNYQGKIDFVSGYGFKMVRFLVGEKAFEGSWWQNRKARKLILRLAERKNHCDDLAMSQRLNMKSVS